jgi:LysM repeat protein
VEQGVTSRSAWTDERIEQLDARIDETRAENEALRIRMDDLSDQISGLGGEVSSRLADLAKSDENVAAQIRRTARSADELDAQRERDREELLARMNVIVDELVQENAKLRERLESLENSAFIAGRMHEVKQGESIDSIARKYGVSVRDIVEANELSDANLINVGQELLIPVSGR